MWYGYKNVPHVSNSLRIKSQRFNKKNIKFGKLLKSSYSFPSPISNFRVPAPWKLSILRNKKTCSNQSILYLYSSTYYYNFALPSNLKTFTFDKNLQTLTFVHIATPYCYFSVLKAVQLLLNTFQKPFFLKIKFRGKGYYVYKNSRQTIAPQFGYAHRVYVYAQACSVKFLSKTKILLFGLSKKEVLSAGHAIRKVKPINIFTGRGIRFARQIIYKKTGKVSTYR